MAARLAAVPTVAQQRMRALRERVRAAELGSDGRTSAQQGTEHGVHGRRYKVKVAPSAGHCLFHALACGLRGDAAVQKWAIGASMGVRESVAQHMLDHPDEEVGEEPIRQWVRQETGKPLRMYATGMRKKGWGSAIEISVAAKIFDRHIEVYKRA